jgi:hypothetical protein
MLSMFLNKMAVFYQDFISNTKYLIFKSITLLSTPVALKCVSIAL